VKGHFDVTYLPQGDGPNATHAACLGGWQLMLPAYRLQQSLYDFLSDNE
jgi:hypothetical protein